ncbi:hypothetical protein H0E87_005687, partial [Populus deltoides]
FSRLRGGRLGGAVLGLWKGAGNGKGMADDSEDSSGAPLLSGSLLCQKEGQMAVFRQGSLVCQCCFPVTVGGRAERRREGQAAKGAVSGAKITGQRGGFVAAPARQKKEGSLWFGREPGDQGNGGQGDREGGLCSLVFGPKEKGSCSLAESFCFFSKKRGGSREDENGPGEKVPAEGDLFFFQGRGRGDLCLGNGEKMGLWFPRERGRLPGGERV